MREGLFGIFFLVGAAACGSNPIVAADASPDAPPADGGIPVVEGGGGGDGGGDAGVDSGPKPRVFVDVVTTASRGVLMAWDDPDSVSAPKPPDFTLDVGMYATEMAVAKNKRLFVSTAYDVAVFDDALKIGAQSTPTRMAASAFRLAQGDPMRVWGLFYEPTLDVLVTADDGPGGVELFANASTMTVGTKAQARFGGDSDDFQAAALGPTGQLYGANPWAGATKFWNNAQTASGDVAVGAYVNPGGRIALGGSMLFVPGVDFGQSGAAVYAFSVPIQNNMAAPSYELHTAFGAPSDTDSATSVAYDPTFLAVAARGRSGKPHFLCVLANPSSLGSSSTCANKIQVAGVTWRLAARKGALYATVQAANETVLQIYRSPLTDTQPTVALSLGVIIDGATVAFAEP